MKRMRKQSGKWFPDGEEKQGRRSSALTLSPDFGINHLNSNRLGPEVT